MTATAAPGAARVSKRANANVWARPIASVQEPVEATGSKTITNECNPPLAFARSLKVAAPPAPVARHQAGVTLIELLIAVSLVSFLSLGMVMAIRVGLNAMEKTQKRFTMNRRVTSVQKIIESQIGGLMPVTAECRGGAGGGGKFLFFQGRPQSLRFVSTYSLQEAGRGYPRIISFEVAPSSEGVRLIVNETIYPGPITAGFFCLGMSNGLPVMNDFGANPQSFVLADKLAYCRILYRANTPPTEPAKWLPLWPEGDRLPSGIRIEMGPTHPDPSRLQVMPVTVPLRITKMVLGPYADEY